MYEKKNCHKKFLTKKKSRQFVDKKKICFDKIKMLTREILIKKKYNRKKCFIKKFHTNLQTDLGRIKLL